MRLEEEAARASEVGEGTARGKLPNRTPDPDGAASLASTPGAPTVSVVPCVMAYTSRANSSATVRVPQRDVAQEIGPVRAVMAAVPTPVAAAAPNGRMRATDDGAASHTRWSVNACRIGTGVST